MKIYRDYLDSRGLISSQEALLHLVAPIKLWLGYFMSRNKITEIRIIDHKTKSNHSGYFDNPKDGVKAIFTAKPFRNPANIPVFKGEYPRSGEAMSIYFLLNKVNKALLCRCKNHMERAQTTTSDADITEYSFLYVDLDVDKPALISSNKEEKLACFKVLKTIKKFFKKYGINPITCNSGNGYHILVPISLPNSIETVTKIKTILAYLQANFGNDLVKVDQTVYTPARINKLYGTAACKGEHALAEGRPHTISHPLHIPQKLLDNPAFSYDIDVLIKDIPEIGQSIKTTTTTTFSGNDQKNNIELIKNILTKENITFNESDKIGRHLFCLETCPVHTDPDEHKFECAIIIESNGAFAFSCKHNVDYHWQDIKEKINFRDHVSKLETIPPGVDINDFFYSSSADSTSLLIPTVSPLILTPQVTVTGSDSTAATSINYKQFRGVDTFIQPSYLIPAPELFQTNAGTIITGPQGSGKTTVLIQGILMPMLEEKPVLGQYEMPRVQTLFVNGDNDGDKFMTRFLTPYGYDPKASYAKYVDFFHVKNLENRLSEGELFLLIRGAARDGVKWIILDNKTSLFLSCVYGKTASESALRLVDGLLKIAIEFHCNITILEHVKKRGILENFERLTAQDVLGTSTLTIDQVIGVSPKMIQTVTETNNKKIYNHQKKDAEGVVYNIKNADGLEAKGYKLLKDSTYYLIFDSDTRLVEPDNGEYVESIDEHKIKTQMVKQFLLTYKEEFEWGELHRDLGKAGHPMHSNTLRNYINSLKNHGLIMVVGGGAGHKTKIKIDKNVLGAFNYEPLSGLTNAVPDDPINLNKIYDEI